MGRWSLICASVKQRIEEVNVQARKLFLVSSRKGVDSDKIFHIFFAFQKTLSVESVQQFPKPSNLQRSDSGFNWNNEIHLIWWIEGGALTWITGVSSYFNLSCIILFTKPESLKYTLYPFGPQTFSLSLRNLWKLWPSGGRIYTATAQVWWFSIKSLLLIQVEHSGLYLIMRIMHCFWNAISTLCLSSAGWALFLRLGFGHLVSNPIPQGGDFLFLSVFQALEFCLTLGSGESPILLLGNRFSSHPPAPRFPGAVLYPIPEQATTPRGSPLTHFPRIPVFCNFSFHSPCPAAGPDAQSTVRGVYPSVSILQLFSCPSSSWLNPFHWVTWYMVIGFISNLTFARASRQEGALVNRY